MKRYYRVLTTAFICLALLLPGCDYLKGSSAHKVYPPKDPKVANCEPGKWGGQLKLPLASVPLTLNPFVPSTLDTYEVTSKLFGTLLDYDHANQKFANPADGLARSIDTLQDDRTYIIHLREGAKFSDGTPITADDVVFSFEAAMNKDVDSIFGDLMRIDGKSPEVSKDDALTVRITFADHYEPMKMLFAKLPIVSRASLQDAYNKGNFKTAYGMDTPPEKIVCSGPFMIKGYTKDKQIDLVYNPYYWKVDSSGTSLPYLDSVVYYLKTPRKEQSFNMLTKTDFHAAQVVQTEFGQFNNNPRFLAKNIGPSLHAWQLALNWRIDKNKIDPIRATWFRTGGFRWALSSAIDRDRIVKEVFDSMARPVYGPVVPANTTWHNPNIKRKEMELSLEEARKQLLTLKFEYREDGTLKASGSSVRFTIIHLDDHIPNQIAQRLVEDFKKLGIQAESDPKDYAAFWRAMSLGIYDAALVESAPMFPDPAFLQPYVSKNGRYFWFYEGSDELLKGSRVGGAEPWMDRVNKNLNEALKKTLLEERRELYNQVQSEWADKAPVIYLVNEDIVVAAQNFIGNFKPAVIDPPLTWNIEEFYIKKND